VGSLAYNKKRLEMMDIEKITSEEEYRKVLQRIDELFNAKKDTPEYEELQHLTDLVDDYEDGLL
jgi:HTH-type transcriptional regulator/antitoxin HigA